MQKINNEIIYSPSDLVLYADSPFASWMAHYVLIDPEIKHLKNSEDAVLSVLQEKGFQHEADVLADFERQNKTIKDMSWELSSDEFQVILEAIREDYEVFYLITID